MIYRHIIMRFYILIVLSFLGLGRLFATQRNLYDLMQEDDYIKASLIILSPGEALYSVGGHLALRMSCPIQNVDYIYEFDASLNQNESVVFNFLNGNLKGKYVRLYTSDFFGNVHLMVHYL